MSKRSPRYPRQSLATSLEQTRKLFAGAHQSKVDVDTAAKVIGYSGSGGGAASSALGALRQYGLVDGLRGDMGVSDLAMRILQPMNDGERTTALREAAMKPEIFARTVSHFGGRLPSADEPIRAFLIRQEGFSAGGANEVVKTLRDTIGSLPEARSTSADSGIGDLETEQEKVEQAPSNPNGLDENSAPLPAPALGAELITLPLGQGSKAELRLYGEVTSSTYSRLIRHLELLKEIFDEEDQARDP